MSGNALMAPLSQPEGTAFMQEWLKGRTLPPIPAGAARPWDAVLWTTPQGDAQRMRPWMRDTPA